MVRQILWNVMFKYAPDVLFNQICACVHPFPQQESEHWRNQVSEKGLVSFYDLLELKVFTERTLDISVSRSMNQKTPSTALKKSIFSMFWGINCFINQDVADIWTSPSVKVQRYRSEAGKFVACNCYWCGDFCLSVLKKNKMAHLSLPLKISVVIEF